jgi:hypothetical protein
MKIIDVFISKLRKKLALAGADNLIGMVWGRGYMGHPPPSRCWRAHGCPHGRIGWLPETARSVAMRGGLAGDAARDLGEAIRNRRTVGDGPVGISSELIDPIRSLVRPNGQGRPTQIVTGGRHDDDAFVTVRLDNSLNHPMAGDAVGISDIKARRIKASSPPGSRSPWTAMRWMEAILDGSRSGRAPAKGSLYLASQPFGINEILAATKPILASAARSVSCEPPPGRDPPRDRARRLRILTKSAVDETGYGSTEPRRGLGEWRIRTEQNSGQKRQ